MNLLAKQSGDIVGNTPYKIGDRTAAVGMHGILLVPNRLLEIPEHDVFSEFIGGVLKVTFGSASYKMAIALLNHIA